MDFPQKSIQPNHIEEMRNELKKIMVSIINNQFQDVFYLNIPPEYCFNISEEKLNHLIDCATLNCLYVWFSLDETLSQTIYKLARNCTEIAQNNNTNAVGKKKYLRYGEKQATDKYSGYGGTYNALDRAYLKYAKLILSQQWVTNKRWIKSTKYKQYFDYKKSGPIHLHFIELCFLELQINGNNKLIDLLFHQKEYLTTTHTKGFEALEQAYNSYFEALYEINNITDPIEFVVSCMQFYKTETSYRFVFIAKLAKYMIDKKIPIDQKLPPIINLFIARMPYPRINKKPTETLSPFITGYDRIFEQAFPIFSIGKSNADAFYYSYLYALFDRALVDYTKILYFENHPRKALSHWSDSDFENAATFLRENIKICDLFKDLELHDSVNPSESHFAYIHKLCNDPLFFDHGLRNQARNAMSELDKLLKQKQSEY